MTDKEKTALFIGNRDCYQVKEADIERAIINAIEDGIENFLNGSQGYFDQTCSSVVHRLKKRYPQIKSIFVIPYRDFSVFNDSLFDEIVYPFESHTFSFYTYKGNIPKRSNPRRSVEHRDLLRLSLRQRFKNTRLRKKEKPEDHRLNERRMNHAEKNLYHNQYRWTILPFIL